MKSFLFFATTYLLAGINLYSQNIANYIGNGSFEKLRSNCNVINLKEAKYWNSIDSISNSAFLYSYCNGMVPYQFNTEFQKPRKGNVFIGTTFYYSHTATSRQYIKNRLVKNLYAGQIYCVKFYVNIMNTSTLGSDGFGLYFGSGSIDTIKQVMKPLTFITPQIRSISGAPIIDTLGWTPVTGTFVADGNEKYAIIGMFEPNGTMDTVLLNPTFLPLIFVDACIDEVSCIPIDLPAYGGPNKNCIVGDSVFIGREPDVEIDGSCIWYKLNNNGTLSLPIDTVAGLYVKPVTTTTYVVRQQLWCSGVKWDTVVVYQDFVGLPHVSASEVENDFKIKMLSNHLTIENANAQNYSLNIYDSQGNQIFKQTNINQNFEYHFSENQSGVYVVQIQNQQGVLRKKVVYVRED